jgi:hypothetical protein
VQKTKRVLNIDKDVFTSIPKMITDDFEN